MPHLASSHPLAYLSLLSRQETAVVSTPVDADAVIQDDWTPLRQRRREGKQTSNYLKDGVNGKQSRREEKNLMQEMTSRKTENITLRFLFCC